MSDHHCPVEGCDYGEDEQQALDSVKGHINGSVDNDHDWSELRAEVRAQAEDSEESAEADEETANTEETETEENEDMPTEEEYQQQHDEQDSADEETDDGDSGGGGLSLPSLDRRTMMLLVGVLGVLVFLYVIAQRRGNDAEPLPDSETTETEDGGQESDDTEEVSLIE